MALVKKCEARTKDLLRRSSLWVLRVTQGNMGPMYNLVKEFMLNPRILLLPSEE